MTMTDKQESRVGGMGSKAMKKPSSTHTNTRAPRYYYVVAFNGNKYHILVGAFDQYEQAQAKVSLARDLMIEHDDRTKSYSFYVTQGPEGWNPPGIFNAELKGTYNTNPRFVLWALANDHDPHSVKHSNDGETTKIDGTPWTVLFMAWMSKCWQEWATKLGFNGDYRAACIQGHTAAEFDAWLSEKVFGKSPLCAVFCWVCRDRQFTEAVNVEINASWPKCCGRQMKTEDPAP